jgi:hypothetical protein
MDFQLERWLSIAVALYSVYQQRKQTQIMVAQELSRAARRRGEVPMVSWWKLPAIPALVILVILAWVPWLKEQFLPKDILIGKSFGSYLAIVDQNTKKFTKMTLYIAFNGQDISWYKSSFKVVDVALHYLGDKDIEDVTTLQKSSTYYIKDERQQLLIEADHKYID